MFHLLAVKKAKKVKVFNDKVKHTSQTMEITLPITEAVTKFNTETNSHNSFLFSVSLFSVLF